MNNDWSIWFQELFPNANIRVDGSTIIISGYKTKSLCIYIHIRPNGNLKGIGLCSSSEKWKGFYVVINLNEIHKVSVIQDSISAHFGRHDLSFTQKNRKDVLTFLRNTVSEGWTETTYYYNTEPFRIQFSFGKHRTLELSQFIYPMAEMDYPLLGTWIYTMYYRIILKLASKKITKDVLNVERLIMSENGNVYEN